MCPIDTYIKSTRKIRDTIRRVFMGVKPSVSAIGFAPAFLSAP